MRRFIARMLGVESRALTYDQYAWMAVPATAAGIAVGPQTALQSPTCFACVRLIWESVAALPVVTYRRLADGGKERADDHPVETLLHDPGERLDVEL